MLKSLSIEWLKLKNYRTFWWLMGLFVVSLIGSNYISYQIKSVTGQSGRGGLDMLLGSPFSFPEVWQTVAYVSSFVLFLPGFLMVILITNEYSFKTHRQNIIDGVRRSAFALTKIIMAVCLSLLSTVLVFIIAMTTGFIAGGGFSLSGSEYILYFLLQALSYTLGGLLLGTLLKRSGLAIAIYLIYIAIIKNLLALLANHYLGGIGSYTPIKSADQLIPLPFFKSVAKELITPPDLTWLLIMTIAYLIAFYWITLRKFNTQDL